MRERGRARDAVEHAALAAAFALLRTLPEPAAQWLGARLGDAAYLALARRRRVALDNLARVWGDRLDPAARRRLARRAMESLGLLVADFARLPILDRKWVDAHVRWEGFDGYLAAKARGKGVLYLAAHFGSWELIPFAQAVIGHPMAFIVRPADNPRVEAVVRAYRERLGNVAIGKREALFDCFRRLKAGGTVGILIDQHVPADRGVASTLLGQKVYTTGALAALALRTGAPVLPAFAVREPGGRHRIVLGPEVAIETTGDRERDVVAATARFNEVVARWVEEYPDHWLWAHRRFREGA